MSAKEYPVVGRMEGLWPHQLGKFEMHRNRRGGDLGHVDRTRKNRLLAGDEDWAAKASARIDEIRYDNYNREIAALEKRKRKKDLMTRMVEGPRDPWRDSKHGPMRELILMANKGFFGSDLDGFFGAANGIEQRFETLAIEWLKKTFGDDLVHARADLDETAYHIHAVILPVETTKDGRTMVQPSKHALIADYEHFQDEIGNAFAPLGLIRGERRAQAIREARGRKEKPPRKRQHVRTRTWREEEERRLTGKRTQLEADEAEQRRKAAETETAMQAERAALEAAKAEQQLAATKSKAALKAERARLAEQAAEQDAVLAGAEALGVGLIDLAQDAVTLAPAKADDPAAARIITRINKSPLGWRRFAAALAPGWQRMRHAAMETAEAKLAAEKARVADDRAEIEGVWQKLTEMTRHLLPKDGPAQTAREQVARVLARWRVMQDRDSRRNNPAQRDD